MSALGRLGLRIAVALALAAAGVIAVAQTPPAERPELKFRRVFAPANGIRDWPRGNVRYLPVDPDEFEHLVQSTSGLPVEATNALAARLVRARYSAGLEDDLLTAGQATLDVEHSAAGAVLLPLAPCNLALTPDGHGEPPEQAMLGLRPDGRLAMLVKQSGPVRLGWTLRGRRDASGAVEFDFQLPPSTDNRFELDLPAQTMPVASAGLLSTVEGAAANRRRWLLELGGEHRFNLRIAPSDPASQGRRLALLRTATTYEFSSRGIDVSSQWKLDAQHDPLRQIEISLDSGLQLVSAFYGETPVAWSTTAGKQGASRLVVELPETARAPARVLRLTAMAPLRLDNSILLPRIQPVGLTWQEGTLSIMLPEPFQLQQLLTFSCRQSKVGPLPAALTGEALEFQCFGPDATAQVLVARQREPLRVASGVEIGLASGLRTARWVGNLEVSGGERFHLLANVPRHWVVDSLETIPEDDLADWSVVEAEGSDRLLNVRLATAVTANHPVRLVISARGRTSPLVKRLSPSDVDVVKIRGAQVRRELVGLRPIGAFQIQLDGEDEPLRLDPLALSAADRQLFSDPPPEIILERSTDAPRWWAAAVAESPRYHAQIETQVEALPGHLRHSWRLECTPDGLPLEKLLVYLTHAGRTPPKWSYAEEKLGRLVPRKLSAQQQTAAGLPSGGEAWELMLNRPQHQPLEIRATRDDAWQGSLPVALACVPLAASQEATLAVRAGGDLRLNIENARLEAIEPAPAADGGIDLVRGLYRYDPQRETVAETAAAVRLALASESPEQAGALVWSQRVESIHEPSGRAVHQATWHIENSGRDTFQVDLGVMTRVIDVWVNERPHHFVADRSLLEITLPHGRRFVTVVVQYEGQQQPWAHLQACSVSHPRVDLPVVSRDQLIWLPTSYRVMNADAVSAAAREPSASRRLFGPLGRDAQQPPFDPVQVHDWAALVGIGQFAEHSKIALAFLRQLGQQASPAAKTGKAPRWGAVLSPSRPSTPIARVAVLVDWQALADAGVWPATPAAIEAADASNDQDATHGLTALQHADLALLVTPEAIVVTTAAAAEAHADELKPLGLRSVYAVGSGVLQRQVSAGSARESARFIHAAAWRSEIAPPWHTAEGRGDWHPTGWTAYRLGPTNHGAILVISSAVVQAAAGLAFFALLLVGVWLRPLLLLLGAGLCAAAALLLPATIAPIACAGLLGLMAAFAFRIVLPRRQASDRAPLAVTSGSTATRLAGGVAIVLLVLGVCAARVLGAEPAAIMPGGNIFAVFIPSDDDGKPTGQRYLVPEELYKALRQRALEARGEPEGWLLRGAHYQASFDRAMGGNVLQIEDCVASFNIEVLSPAARVTIPLGASGLAEVPRQGLLDGRVVPLDWQAKAGKLECVIADPGTYHLDVPLKPLVRTGSDWTGFEVSIPSDPMSRTTLRLPPDPLEVQLPVTAGPVVASDDGRTLEAPLGTASQWVVHWPQLGSGRAGPVFDVEELMWLKVRPGSVLLEVKAQLTVDSGQVKRLQVLADPRLRLLPLSGNPWRLVESRMLADEDMGSSEPRELQFQASSPMTEQPTLHATFLLTGTSAFGNLRLPRLEVLGGRSSRRWLAVNVDPALEFEVQNAQQTLALTPTSFTTHWGPSSTAPQVACELPQGEHNWTLATHPRQPRTTARQQLALCVGSGSIDLRYEAQLLTTDGYTFQHRLLAPQNLQIESVSVLEDGVQRAAHWGRDRAGVITVLLTAPVTGAQQLVVQGSLPAPAVGATSLPLVKFEESNFKDTPILLYRRASVLASLENLVGLSETAERADPAPSPWPRDRLASALVATSESPTAELRIKPNAPRATVMEVISLGRDGTAWQVTSDSIWNVADGVLDNLRLEIPANWSGPFTITPAADYEVLPLPQQKTKHLIVRPHSPIRDKYRLSITGPVSSAGGEPLSMSDVRPLGVEASRRMFRLPRQVGLQHVVWETSDLRPAELPAELRSTAPVADTADILQATGPTAQVRLKAIDRVTAVPQVKLADIHVRWRADDTFCGLACFDLQPAYGKHCRFRMPKGCELVRVSVDGLIATPLAAGDRQWDVPLAAPSLPQRIEMLFTGSLVEAGWQRIELEAPMPQGVPVEKTLWSVQGPDAAGPGEMLGGKTSGALRAELARLESVAALSNLPTEAVSGSGGDELKSWYRVWYGHWNAARRSARQMLLESPHGGQTLALEAEMKAMEREQAAIAGRLATSEGPSTAGLHEAVELWAHAQTAGRRPTRSIFDGAAPAATIRYPRPAQALWWTRLVFVAASSVLVLVLLLLIARGLPVADWVRRWPHPLAMCLALAWWLWLTPSVLGLVGAVLVLLISLRSGLRRAHDAPTSVMRLGTTR